MTLFAGSQHTRADATLPRPMRPGLAYHRGNVDSNFWLTRPWIEHVSPDLYTPACCAAFRVTLSAARLHTDRLGQPGSKLCRQ
jgi:hypothetical protein